MFAVTTCPTPVFNTPDPASYLGKTLRLDQQNLLRCVETVLFPGTKLRVIDRVLNPSLWKIETDEYPYPGDCFVEDGCLNLTAEEPPSRPIRLPAPTTFLRMAKHFIGIRYIWGGNWPLGLPDLSHRFAGEDLSPLAQDTRRLKGVDCSGLLYFLSDGYTPRNTSALLHFGEGVAVAGQSLEGMVALLRPLDLIVYKGHVVLVFDEHTTLESRLFYGVVQVPVRERLLELFESKTPIDDPRLCGMDHFVVRRWYPARKNN